MDYKFEELEVHNVTKFKSEEIADLIKSRGFEDELITPDHPGFKETEEHFKALKESMDPEEYQKMLEEMRTLMAEPPKVDPEEKKAEEIKEKMQNAEKFKAHITYAKKEVERKKKNQETVEKIYSKIYSVKDV